MAERPNRGNPVPAAAMAHMFDRIAPIYDAMNTVMTAGLDARWRDAAVRAAGLHPGMAVLDVACGTGALTRAAARAVAPGGRAVGVDISPRMLRIASRRPATAEVDVRYERGDALALPVPAATYDAAMIGFGLRNVSDYGRCLAEMKRAVRPGGRVVVLELATPTAGAGRLIAATWFERVVPLLGRLAGGGGAYRYLAASVRSYPAPPAVARLLVDAGLVDVGWRRLWPGLVTLHVGRRP